MNGNTIDRMWTVRSMQQEKDSFVMNLGKLKKKNYLSCNIRVVLLIKKYFLLNIEKEGNFYCTKNCIDLLFFLLTSHHYTI